MASCRILLPLCCAACLVAPGVSDAGERGLLWRVVQTCIINHQLTGASFPCLAVETDKGPDRGYAVLRAPFEDTHIIVTPTVKMAGIETEALRAPDAPNYFRDAWLSRHFVTQDLKPAPARDDLGLAINSKAGRSQDQLHIHVDCLRREVKRSLTRQAKAIKIGSWSHLSILPQAPRYWVTAVESEDLAGLNIFNLVAAGTHIDREDMDDTTVVIAGSADVGNGAPGFVVLARQRRPDHNDQAHGEALLDHACKEFR